MAVPGNLRVKIAKLPSLRVFCMTINGAKDAKMWLRRFALHPKDALPTHMGFHHSFFTVRILTVGFLGAPPNGPPKPDEAPSPDTMANGKRPVKWGAMSSGGVSLMGLQNTGEGLVWHCLGAVSPPPLSLPSLI